MSFKRQVKQFLAFAMKSMNHRPVTANIVKLCNTELLKGRMALITGGTSGIGYAIADAFLEAGANIVITSRSAERVSETIKYLATVHPSRKILGVEMELSNVADIQHAYENIVKQIGTQKIDILVNNAGLRLDGGPFFTVTEEDFSTILDVNLKGTFYLSRIVAKYMIENKISGNILNISSSSGIRPADSAYKLSKWGIRGLTTGLAKKLIPYGIVVNAIAPGQTATPMLGKEATDDIGHDTQPIGRYVLPEEIANMAVFLTSEMGRSIVGDIIYMTGGVGVITLDDIHI